MKKVSGIVRFVDIDETVFHTTAKVKIVSCKTGEALRTLSNKEWNSYDKEGMKARGEKTDFSEFADSRMFFNESKPIVPMIEKLREWSREMRVDPKHKGDMVVFITARGDFDDRERFLDSFRKELIGIDDTKHFYISRTGNLSNDTMINNITLSTSQRKKIEYLHYLMAKMPSRAEIYEDDETNIKDFLTLKEEMPFIEYKAFLIKNGKIEEYCESK